MRLFLLSSLLLLLLDATDAFVVHRPRHLLAWRQSSSGCFAEGRRKKKNKYADFSKADKLKNDPLDAMVEEAEQKNQELKKKIKRENNQVILEEIDYDETRGRNEIIFPDNREIDPYDPTTYGYVELGTLVGAHGVKGEVKISSVTDFAERLCRPGLRHIKLPNRRSPRRIQLLDGRHRMDDEYLIRLGGVGDRDAANKLRGCVLYAREEERPEELGEDEYIVSDLVGLDVFMENGYENEEGEDQGGKFVGVVNGVVLAEEMCTIPGLGQDLFEISLPRGPGATASWKDELVLIPFVPQLVPRVDIVNRIIYIAPPFGLLDLTYVREEKVRIKGFLPPGR
mmetsp:Transcript_14457/g.23922  ORF Transcript_14457/g.23922 Transcript_14457/m.23922 type:complete len:340 (-) Transcript_14457:201-1220(-)